MSSDPPLRICFVITELDVGGAERCLVNLACGLDPDRFACKVIALGPPPEPGQESLVCRLQAAQIPTEFLGARSMADLLRTSARLRREIARHAPDIVQSFLFHANVLTALNRPWRGDWRLVSGIRVADPDRKRQWLERRAHSRIDHAVCVSQSVADYAARHLKLSDGRRSVIPNGIEIPEDSPSSTPTSRRQILYLGRLHYQKGLDWLLGVAPEFLAVLTDHDLVLVGDGPDRELLERMVETHQLTARVRFAGWQPDVEPFLRSSSLLVLPSRWEGMPNVLLEAMAQGRAVLSTRTDGVEQLLGPLADAQTVEFGDDRQLVERITQLCQDDATRAKLGDQNRARVRDQFSLQAMVNAYADLYQTLYLSALAP